MDNFDKVVTFISWVIAIIAVFALGAILIAPAHAARVTWVDNKPVIEGPSAPVQGCFNGGFQIEVAPDCSKPDSNESK